MLQQLGGSSTRGAVSALRRAAFAPSSARWTAARNLATMLDDHAAAPASDQQQPEASTSSTSMSKLSKVRAERAALPISAARRGPSPLTKPEDIEAAQQVYLPNIVFRLVRNGPNEAGNPYIATFRVPPQLTKPDIVSYLAQIYGLKATSISTVIQMGEIKRRTGFNAKSRKKTIKKAIVGMEEPFWFPDRRSTKWLNDNFEKESRQQFLTRRLLPVGDGGPGRGRRSWRWRGSNSKVQGIGARYSQIIKRIQERRTQQEGIVKREAAKEAAALQQEMQQMSVSDQ